jgi:hypothetical protein
MQAKRGFSRRDVVVGVGIGLVLLCMVWVMMPRGVSARTPEQMINGSQLRGIHQSAVTYANSNGSYLPGFNSSGFLLDSTDAQFSSLTGGSTGTPGLGGGAMNTRLYILLNGGFIGGDLLINSVYAAKPGPVWKDPSRLPTLPGTVSKTTTQDYTWWNRLWVGSRPMDSGEFSYSLLNISDRANGGTVTSKRSPGRAGEWRDNANSQAILISDCNTADNTISPRSMWSFSIGTMTDWRGNVVWGDNHAEFLTSFTNLTTKYLDSVNTGDSLFSDADPGNPGERRDNAFFNYVSANY